MPVSGKNAPEAGAPEVEITPAMIEAGLTVLYESGIVDGRSAEDSPLVAEIFESMWSKLGRKK